MPTRALQNLNLTNLSEAGFVEASAFGAIGDGVVDDTAALQRWLDAVVAAGPGAVGILGAGVFRTGNLVLADAVGTTISGRGAQLLLFGTASPTTRIGLELRGTIDTLVIDGLWFRGDAVEANRHAGVWNPSDPLLTNVTIQNCVVQDVTLGISLNADTSGALRNCRILNNDVRNVVGIGSGMGYGIHVADNTGVSSSVLVQGNSIDQAQRHSIYLAAGFGVRCIGNRIDRHRDGTTDGAVRGAIVAARGGDITIADNTITRPNNAAIFLDAGDGAGQTLTNVTVIGNTISDPVVSAFLIPLVYVGEDLAMPSDFIDSVTIVGNTIRTNGWSGQAIRLNWGRGIVVAQNVVRMLGVVATTFPIAFQARGEAAASATWSDRWQVVDNDIAVTDGGGGAASVAFRLNPPFNTGSSTSLLVANNRTSVPAAPFNTSAAVTNPNISVAGQPTTGLAYSAGVRQLGFPVSATQQQFANGVLQLSGAGDPEGAVTAPVGSTWQRDNGGAGTSLYVKESGTGNTGWAAK